MMTSMPLDISQVIKAPKKFDYEETTEYLKNCSYSIDEDLQHALKCLNRFSDSALTYEVISLINHVRDRLEELTSESFFLAHKLNKEIKRNVGK